MVELIGQGLAEAADREPAQIGGEDREQHQADVEHRHRQADLEGAADHGIGSAIALQRGGEGQRQRQQQRQERGKRGQHQGDRQPLLDQLDDRDLQMDRGAEIALQEPLEEDRELDRDRLVQAELGD